MSNSINEFQMMEILSARKGAQIVSIIAVTEPNLLKTGNPFYANGKWSIKKVSHVNGMIGWDYQNSVNNQLIREDKEPDFVAEPRKWGERIKGTPFVKHTKKGDSKATFYLELKVNTNMNLQTEYLDIKTNEPIDKSELEGFYPKSSSRQGTDKEVVLRDYKLSSIVQLRIGGEVYPVKHAA